MQGQVELGLGKGIEQRGGGPKALFLFAVQEAKPRTIFPEQLDLLRRVRPDLAVLNSPRKNNAAERPVPVEGCGREALFTLQVFQLLSDFKWRDCGSGSLSKPIAERGQAPSSSAIDA